jgi:hypothetical protein
MAAELLLAIAKRQRIYYREYVLGKVTWGAYNEARQKNEAPQVRTLGRNTKRKQVKEQARQTNQLHADKSKSPESAKKMARLIADIARRGKAREAPILPPARRIDIMDRPGEVTTSELEASQVFAAHLGGIGAAATTSTAK